MCRESWQRSCHRHGGVSQVVVNLAFPLRNPDGPCHGGKVLPWSPGLSMRSQPRPPPLSQSLVSSAALLGNTYTYLIYAERARQYRPALKSVACEPFTELGELGPRLLALPPLRPPSLAPLANGLHRRRHDDR